MSSLCRSDLSFDAAQDPEALEGPVAILSSRPWRDSYKNGEAMNVNTIMRPFMPVQNRVITTEAQRTRRRVFVCPGQMTGANKKVLPPWAKRDAHMAQGSQSSGNPSRTVHQELDH
jgi:hypothetical protein